jgi:hypothetical protein
MSEPEINNLKRNLLLLAVGVNAKSLEKVTGERYDAVSCVLNELRPRRRTRKKVVDEIARRVYELFHVPEEDRPPSLTS